METVRRATSAELHVAHDTWVLQEIGEGQKAKLEVCTAWSVVIFLKQ